MHFVPSICFLYQETHRVCTRALLKAQRDMLRRKNATFSTPLLSVVYKVSLLDRRAYTPGRRPPANLLTSWEFLFCPFEDLLSCAAATMGAASSSEVVAEKLREMGEGDAQRP